MAAQGKRDIWLGHAAVLAANIIFALNAPFSKHLMSAGGISGEGVALWRTAGATLLFWLASLLTPREPIAKKDWLWLLGATVFGIICNQGPFVIGLEYTSPIDAVLLKTLTPILTMLIAAVYLRNKISGYKCLGVLLGLCGATFLILSENGFAVSFDGNFRGNVLVIASTLAYALYFALFIKVIEKYSAVTVMKWLFLFSTLLCLPFWGDDMLNVAYADFGWMEWGALFFAVFFATFLSYFLLPVAQKRLLPTTVSMYIYSQPVVVALVGVCFGGAPLLWEQGLAAAFIFVGVYIVQTKSFRR